MHRLTFLSLIACIFSLTSAINFTYPTGNITLSHGSTYPVTWTTVDTDPTQFSIYLWNFKYFPPYYTFLTQVQTSAQSKNITIPCNVPVEDGWQFTAINGTNVYVIYAQTRDFTIRGTACTSPIVGPNPEGSIVTVTETVTRPGGKGATATCPTTPISTCDPKATSTITTTSTAALSTTTVTDVHTKTECRRRHPHPPFPGHYARRTAA